MDFSASAATKDAARLRRRRFCTPPRFFSTLPDTGTSRNHGNESGPQIAAALLGSAEGILDVQGLELSKIPIV